MATFPMESAERARQQEGREKEKVDFRKGCRRLNEHNHIPIVVDQQSLDAAEELAGVSARQLGKYLSAG